MTDHESFPIMDPAIPSIPWAMLAPHEAQARRNHGGQSLTRLAERGGLSPDEALHILDDREWSGREFILPKQREERDRHAREKARELRQRVENWQGGPTP